MWQYFLLPLIIPFYHVTPITPKFLPIGKVEKLVPPVTILPPHRREAHELQLGEKIVEESSIVTSEKSFALIVLNDGSKLTIAPKSKIVIEQARTKEPAMLQLLVGQVRSQVTQKKNKKMEASEASENDHFFLRTQTAAMGVRGTDFETSFNNENKITALITYEGRVGFNKLDEKIAPEKLIDKKKMVEAVKTQVNTSKAFEGRTGDYIRTTDEGVKAPVKISPVQLTLLKLKEDPTEEKKDIPQKVLDEEVLKIKKVYEKEHKEQEKELKSSERAGGFVDLQSGFYIPPSSKSEKDEKTGLYISKDNLTGSVDNSGNYRPPEGVKILATKGLVIVDEQKAKPALEAISEVNKEIVKDIPKPLMKKSDLSNSEKDPYEHYYQKN